MYGQQPPTSPQQPLSYATRTWSPPPPRTSGLAVAALVLGILWGYGIGSLLAVIFGHVALSNIRRTYAKGTGMAVAGLVLGYVGILGAAFVLLLSLLVSTATPAAPPAEIAVTADSGEAARESAAESGFKAADYRKLTARGFAKLAKNPDAYAGRRFVLYGEVYQFDDFTGTGSFMATSGHAATTTEENSVFYGDEDLLSDVVEGDKFRAYVTVRGTERYVAVNGNDANAPAFDIARIKVG
ncbi:DUF4190 domain-containing protein [Nonomuraea sp. NPDC002799]